MRIFIIFLIGAAFCQASFSEHSVSDNNDYDLKAVGLNESSSEFAKEQFIWRYVPGIGLRKFSAIGAMIKDFKDWERVARWKPWLYY